MRILFIGDVIGRPGRDVLAAFKRHAQLREFLRLVRQSLRAGQAHRTRESERLRRELFERAQGQRAESLRCVGAEQMCAAIDRVHGLAAARLAGVAAGEVCVGLLQLRFDGARGVGREGSFHLGNSLKRRVGLI